MTTEYLKKLGLPLSGQEIVRTYQSVYTIDELTKLKNETENVSNTSDTITFGFLGYFTARKGLREYLQAIKYYNNENAKFIFIGEGPDKKILEEAAKKDPRIEVLPYATGEEAKTKLFRTIYINVVPSERDPWCLVVNEAAARGVPSIVSTYVGAQELMNLVDPELFVMKDNRAVNIARAMLACEKKFKKPELWREIKNKTYAAAAKWSIEKSTVTFVNFAKRKSNG